ncbi:hypothetical protein GKZ90_0016075 [Flavobacterium sp. MC2016-06]|uniref:hypothetical protein n=1 Tax=Flavobacterium sp. MC2016-06 TaxID=2676308 RepID=UPI0012BB0EC4|nr:hypothetical protein [Flavobacterium sp. MC2016-06]MBU3860250.1 hypothetical protein [Flavobacterium sp. MC2016-06]
MKRIVLALIVLFLITSCGKNEKNLHPDLMKPNWDGIKTEKLKFKIGDVVSIFIDKQYYSGIIMDFDEDKGGIWYGISLSDYRWIVPNKKKIKELNFFGRQIPSGFGGDCINCCDLVYLNQKDVDKNIIVVNNIKIDINKISIGSIQPLGKLKEIETTYFQGMKARKRKSAECGEATLEPNRINDRYFKIEDVL